MSRLLYLYGFVPDSAPARPPKLEGVGGTPVELVEVEGLRAAVSRVDAGDFGEEELEARIRDLDWVGQEGARHERVVTWFVDRGGILPARFLTLHSDEVALRQAVQERGGAVEERLRALEGLREWDLKVSVRRDRLATSLGSVSEEVAALDREIESAAPGRRYLLERRREDEVKRRVGEEARRLAEGLLDDLRAFASEAVVLPPPREAGELPVVLNAALLLAEDAETAARDRVGVAESEWEGLGLSVSFTGPWAPYRFADPESDA